MNLVVHIHAPTVRQMAKPGEVRSRSRQRCRVACDFLRKLIGNVKGERVPGTGEGAEGLRALQVGTASEHPQVQGRTP